MKRTMQCVAVALGAMVAFGFACAILSGCAGPTVTTTSAHKEIHGQKSIEFTSEPPVVPDDKLILPPRSEIDGIPVVYCGDFSDPTTLPPPGPVTNVHPVIDPQLKQIAESEPVTAGDFKAADSTKGMDHYIVNGQDIWVPKGSKFYGKATEGPGGSASGGTIKVSAKQASELLAKANLDCPDLNIKGVGSSEGGDSGFSIKASLDKPILFFYIFGGILVVAGVAIVVISKMKFWKLGLAIALSGVALIGMGVMVNKYPWVFLVAFGLLIVGVAVVVYMAWRHHQTETVLDTVVAGTEKVPAVTSNQGVEETIDIAQKVKDQIFKEAGLAKAALVQKVVSKSKKRQGIKVA